MSGVRVSPWLLAAVATAAVAILPGSAAVAPMPAPNDGYSAGTAVRERADRLAEAAPGRLSTSMDTQDEPHAAAELAAAQSQGGLVSAVTDWLERAARDYQSHVIEKLSVSAAAAADGEPGEAPRTAGGGLGEWLEKTVRSAFGWLQGWVSADESSSERETADASPKAPSAPAEAARDAEPKKDPPQQVAANDRSDEDARGFVEARRKADAELKDAQRLAEVRAKTAEEKRRAEADLARRKEEAELKAREDALKAEMARRHEENERRINETLKKLDEAHKAAEEKRREAERAKEEEARKAADRRAALQAEITEAKRVAEEAGRKADEAKRIADEQARAAVRAAEERTLALTAPPAKSAPESAAAPNASAAAAAPPVRANAIPELRLPSARNKAAGESAQPAPDAASEKSATGTKTAASEPPSAQEPKARESVAGEARPRAERSKSARQKPAKRAKAQRRTRETRGPRRGAKLVYVVKPGDTLSGIAERYLGSGKRYDVIYRANRQRIKNPNVIHAYQRIVVPLRKA